MSMATKTGKVVACHKGLPSIKSLVPLITCDLVRSRNKLKALYLHYQSADVHQTW